MKYPACKPAIFALTIALVLMAGCVEERTSAAPEGAGTPENPRPTFPPLTSADRQEIATMNCDAFTTFNKVGCYKQVASDMKHVGICQLINYDNFDGTDVNYTREQIACISGAARESKDCDLMPAKPEHWRRNCLAKFEGEQAG